MKTHRVKTHQPQPPTLLTAQQLADRYQVSLASIWRMVERGVLPSPVYVTARAPRWFPDEADTTVATLRYTPTEAKARRRQKAIDAAKTTVIGAADEHA
jgi:predicted DNA-binding transcriptional regulator AlpA